MGSSRRGERHAEAPHRRCGCDVHEARSRGEGARTAEEAGDHLTGGAASKPWIAEGLRSGSANANHGEGSKHGPVALRRSCRSPCAAERDASHERLGRAATSPESGRFHHNSSFLLRTKPSSPSPSEGKCHEHRSPEADLYALPG